MSKDREQHQFGRSGRSSKSIRSPKRQRGDPKSARSINSVRSSNRVTKPGSARSTLSARSLRSEKSIRSSAKRQERSRKRQESKRYEPNIKQAPQQPLSPKRDVFFTDSENLSSIRSSPQGSKRNSRISPRRRDTESSKVSITKVVRQSSPTRTFSDDLEASHRSDYVDFKPVEDEHFRVDEAFLLYTLAETSAICIQRNFRNKKLQGKDVNETEAHEETGEKLKTDLENKEEEVDAATVLNVLFLSMAGLCMMVCSCLDCTRRLLGNSSDVDAPIPLGEGGGGGGGGVAPPPGLEAMAGNAAASAGSAASSGVAAGASAGAAASASAVAAAAGAAAGVATGQVITAVAVSSAVVATAATASLVAANLGNTTATIFPPATSICGLLEPDIRKGQITMIFEGFSRPIDDREKLIVENLVAEAYNNLTIGVDLESVGCLDPLSREMTEAKLVNQTWDPITEGSNTLLETVLETTLLCGKCNVLQPLFTVEKKGERRLFEHRKIEQDDTNAIDGTNMISVSLFDFTSREFFQKLLQLVIFKTEGLSEIGELPDGFIQMTKAFVTPVLPEGDGVTESESGSRLNAAEPNPQLLEDYLVTEIAYQPQGSGRNGGGDRGAFRFTYVDEETGEEQSQIVLVDATILEDPLVEPIPTTPFPTFVPTRSPTISPSTEPTILFSGQPTREPSSRPSIAPSSIPSDVPTDSPTVVPSVAPSNVPSGVPTDPPSMVPSFQPSEAPSSEPTIRKSIGPTRSPSISPSAVPSYVPSHAPSADPSVSPSMVPSYVPSDSPSMNPSSIPSIEPSAKPSASPSLSPSSLPSATPSRSPTTSPSAIPSMAPSASPTATTWHYVACGEVGQCDGTRLLNSNSVVDNAGMPIGVRCCSDTARAGWAKLSAGCPYAQSTFPACYQSENWYDSSTLCQSFGGRLCTTTELNNQCTTGTGCNHNSRSIWSSTAGTP